ncbi:MAG: TolC family protein [Clostridiales bacterium]|nr:TolC family protein [Clostridiales bacterium]
MKIYNICTVISIACMSALAAHAAPLTLDSCLNAVMYNNISLAAERLNIPIARAEERAAAVFNDPSLSFEYANNDDHRMQMGQSYAVELGYTWSPGKRGARKNLARSERELAEYLFDDYIRQLRLEAATLYHEAVKADELYIVFEELSRSMADIARGDSLGMAIGEVRQVDAMATGVNARRAAADAASALTEYNNARIALAMIMGCVDEARSLQLDCAAAKVFHDIDEDKALTEAIDRRADLRAALKNSEVAAMQLKVEGAERKLDFDFALGYNYNTEVRNEIAPAPRFSGVTVGVSIPLKLSNSNKGAITAARLRCEQAALEYEQAEAEVRAQVMSAIDAYRNARSFYDSLDHSMLETSRAIYNSYLDAYRHGDVSLVELMEVRDNYSEILISRSEARCNLGIAYATVLAAIGR